ncbi:WH1-domain-containing protein [Macrolepiota fuliginosa MF-IS2]|uniref:WH1-domain-containing protein n=1 Tax=Macrolepiota fuliginosa MF-IS2 TaxID=1400762 RepID=A0A9P5XL92_9AGAR|nr:WH1-domain-containing protein [Macrolepiota fuliginosa MF-IS2]
MPAQTVLNPEEKAKIKNAIPESSNKIFSAALARIYYAHPNPQQWSYAGLQGAIVLSKDNNSGAMNLKLVDIDGTRGVIWEHELYDGFELFQDRGFFHSFPGDDCMIGLVYADEQEAKLFFKKVKLKKKLATGKEYSGGLTTLINRPP